MGLLVGLGKTRPSTKWEGEAAILFRGSYLPKEEWSTLRISNALEGKEKFALRSIGSALGLRIRFQRTRPCTGYEG